MSGSIDLGVYHTIKPVESINQSINHNGDVDDWKGESFIRNVDYFLFRNDGVSHQTAHIIMSYHSLLLFLSHHVHCRAQVSWIVSRLQ